MPPRDQAARRSCLILVCLVLTSLLLIIAGCVMGISHLKLQRTWTSTTGTVIRTEICSSSEPNMETPVIEYTANEISYNITPEWCSSSPQVGSHIAVLYDPDDPANGVDASFEGAWLVPIALVLSGLVTCCLALFGKSKDGKGKGAENNDNFDFDQAVHSAEKTQMDRCANNDVPNETNTFETYAGNFHIKYNDDGREVSHMVKIHLESNHDGHGYGLKILRDYYSKVTKGFVEYSGDAWWVEEETPPGTDRSLKVLVVGNFDFAANEFTGTWNNNTGVKGCFTEFKGRNVSKTFVSDEANVQNHQSLEEMLA